MTDAGLTWTGTFRIDAIPRLLASDDRALTYFVRRDVLNQEVGPADELWELPEPNRIVRRQKADGSWRYPGQGPRDFPHINYDLLETFRNLAVLIDMYEFNVAHPAIERAADYIFSCQTTEGDIRGILGNQYMPYYHGAIVELLIKAGYQDDPHIDEALEWLISVRQRDGGWIIPTQALPAKEKTEDMWRGEPIPPDRSKPFSHLATGMVMRAFAAHTRYRYSDDVRMAAARLKERFFTADKYNDRRAIAYWTKLQYPFWWPNLLTALDSLSLMGFTRDNPDIRRGLGWFIANQDESGLWPTGYGSGRKAEPGRRWVALAVLRMFKRFHEDTTAGTSEQGSDTTAQ